MAKLSPSDRGRIAALTRWAKEDPQANAQRGQAGLLKKFMREVDPDNELPENERVIRAQRLLRAHMVRLAARSAEARRTKR